MKTDIRHLSLAPAILGAIIAGATGCGGSGGQGADTSQFSSQGDRFGLQERSGQTSSSSQYQATWGHTVTGENPPTAESGGLRLILIQQGPNVATSPVEGLITGGNPETDSGTSDQ